MLAEQTIRKMSSTQLINRAHDLKLTNAAAKLSRPELVELLLVHFGHIAQPEAEEVITITEEIASITEALETATEPEVIEALEDKLDNITEYAETHHEEVFNFTLAEEEEEDEEVELITGATITDPEYFLASIPDDFSNEVEPRKRFRRLVRKALHRMNLEYKVEGKKYITSYFTVELGKDLKVILTK